MPEIAAQFGDTPLKIADFRHLPVRCGFIAMMPQWDFLNFLAKQAARYPKFQLADERGGDGLVEKDSWSWGSRSATKKSTPIW